MRALRYLLVLVVALELALGEAFLVSARPLGHPWPVAAAAAFVGNLALGRAGARVLDRPAGAAGPGVLWLVVALVLGTRRTEGDLIVTNTWRGIAFLVAGAVAAAVAVGLAGAGKNRATPEAHLRR